MGNVILNEILGNSVITHFHNRPSSFMNCIHRWTTRNVEPFALECVHHFTFAGKMCRCPNNWALVGTSCDPLLHTLQELECDLLEDRNNIPVLRIQHLVTLMGRPVVNGCFQNTWSLHQILTLTKRVFVRKFGNIFSFNQRQLCENICFSKFVYRYSTVYKETPPHSLIHGVFFLG